MKKIFSSKIQPQCAYCELSRLAADGVTVLCEKNGVVASSFSCSRFLYSPIKRTPKRRPVMQYSEDDFKL